MSILANLRYGIKVSDWVPKTNKSKMASNNSSAIARIWTGGIRSVYDTSFGTPITLDSSPLTKEEEQKAKERAAKVREFDYLYDPLPKETKDALVDFSKEDKESFMEFIKIASSISPVDLITELIHYKDEREKNGNPLQLTEKLEPVDEKDTILFGIYYVKMRQGKRIVEAAAAPIQDDVPADPILNDVPADPISDDGGDTMTLAQALDEQEKKKRRTSSKKKNLSPKEDVDPAEAESPQE